MVSFRLIANYKQNKKGFSLIELLITVAIVGILSLLATNLYRNHLIKSRRIEAISTILAIQNAEEQYRMQNTQYGSLAQIGSSGTNSKYYTFTVTNNTATSYTITASANAEQASDNSNGVSCTPLILTVTNNTQTKSPTGCWTYN